MNKLVETRQALGELTLDELADYMASTGVSSQNANTAQAEFLRRQTSSIVQTGTATRSNARYMLAAVVVLTLSSLLSATAMVYTAHRTTQVAHMAQAQQVTEIAPLVPPAPVPAPVPAIKKSTSLAPRN